jgi:hypothetical protein
MRAKDYRESIIEIQQGGNPDPNCLINSADDEPVFVLVARDRAGASTVRYWVSAVEGLYTQEGVTMSVATRRKLDLALVEADRMDDWRLAHEGGKLPD